MRHLPRAEPAGSTRALIGCGHLAPAGRRASSRDRANGNFTDGSHYDALVQKRNDKEKAELKRMCSHVLICSCNKAGGGCGAAAASAAAGAAAAAAGGEASKE